MRTFVLHLLLYSRALYGFSLWKFMPDYTWIKQNRLAESFGDYENEIGNTGW